MFLLETPTFPFLLSYLVTHVPFSPCTYPTLIFPLWFSTDVFGTIFFQEKSNFYLHSYNTDIASGLLSLKDLCCEHMFLLPDNVMEWQITSFSTSEDIHETPPNCLTLSVSCHLVFQNWSCQVLDENKSKSTPTASRHSQAKGSKKTGFETSRESEANNVRFTKKHSFSMYFQMWKRTMQ